MVEWIILPSATNISKRIDKSVERLIAIVTDLDMINRLEAGEINLTVSKFDVNLLIKEIFDLLDLEAEKKRNTTLQIQTLHPQIFVETDKQKISQVFINLISMPFIMPTDRKRK